MKRSIYISCAVLGITLSLGSAALAASYKVTDIMSFAAGDYVRVEDINNSGTLIANINQQRGFAWSNSTGFSYLLTPSGGAARAMGINDNGQIVGYSALDACLWEQGRPPQKLLSSYSTGSQAYSINNRGQVLGSYKSINQVFLWSAESGIQIIDEMSGGNTLSVSAINNSGMVVGVNSAGAFIWTQNGGVRAVPVENEYNPWNTKYDVIMHSINDAGMVLGGYISQIGFGSQFVWQEETGVEYIPYLQGLFPQVADMNNLGQVVGQAGSTARARPFIWDKANGIQPLSLLPGHLRGAACAINDNGVIAGYSYDEAGLAHLVLWTPVPEPPSFITLLAGVTGLGGLALRRRH